MLKTYNKYTRKIGTLVLLGYLLVSVLTLFHHHNYCFNISNALNESNTANLDLRYLDLSGFECLVHQNFNSLHSISFPKNQHLFSDLIIAEEILRISDTFFQPLNYYSTTQLRAPPFFS